MCLLLEISLDTISIESKRLRGLPNFTVFTTVVCHLAISYSYSREVYCFDFTESENELVVYILSLATGKSC